MPLTSAGSSGGEQRVSFSARIAARIAGSSKPAARIDAARLKSVSLRPPSTIASPLPPAITRSFGRLTIASSHVAGMGATSTSSGLELASHAYERPDVWTLGAATT